MKTNYEGHEAIYARLRQAEGRKGWDDPEEQARVLARLDTIFHWNEIPSGGRLLELGSGAGTQSLHLARRGWEVTGVEISRTAVDWARQNACDAGLDAEFRAGNVLEARPEDAGRYDVVLDGHCLHCIIGADRSTFYATARHALRDGGVLIVATMCGRVPASLVPMFDPATGCIVQHGVAQRYIGRVEDLRDEAVQAAFKIRREELVAPVDDNDFAELLMVLEK